MQQKTISKIISIGAEAVLSLEKRRDMVVVIKKRIPKTYRIPEIDNKLRSSRTRREVKVLEKLHGLGFVPRVLYSDNNSKLEIEYLGTEKLSEVLEQQDYELLGKEIGKKIKKIHDMGIIHGDLTTSNMILIDNLSNNIHNKIYFIDFGLSFFSDKIEDKAVDLHVLEQALESRHSAISKKVFDAVKIGYSDKIVLKRLQAVQKRGRNKN